MLTLKRDQPSLVTFTLNGKPASGLAVEPRLLLTDFLRQVIGLTSVHVACEHGVCGSCTVIVDGKLSRACLMYAVQVQGRTVETVEGLANEDGTLGDLQLAMKRHHGLQCGFCTSGILMSAHAFLKENPDPSEDEVRTMLTGHICRCTGYVGMVRAILDVAAHRNGRDGGARGAEQ